MRRSLESFTDGTHTEVTRVTHRFRQNHGLINIKYLWLEIYFLADRTPEHVLRVTGMLDFILCAFGTLAMAQCAIVTSSPPQHDKSHQIYQHFYILVLENIVFNIDLSKYQLSTYRNFSNSDTFLGILMLTKYWWDFCENIDIDKNLTNIWSLVTCECTEP